MRQLEKKYPPKFENYSKFPTYKEEEPQLKAKKMFTEIALKAG